MKKSIIIVILIIFQRNQDCYSRTATQSVEIGTLEETVDAEPICTHECSKKGLTWNNKWCCLYSPEIKQHNCVCQCVKK